ncbi:MAG: hypothetical protein HYW05_01635 [Candidatus Diapherotrites archaeon]|nr:hypothetical protein [Candidatus Diapherotrites archaeon]
MEKRQREMVLKVVELIRKSRKSGNVEIKETADYVHELARNLKAHKGRLPWSDFRSFNIAVRKLINLASVKKTNKEKIALKRLKEQFKNYRRL